MAVKIERFVTGEDGKSIRDENDEAVKEMVTTYEGCVLYTGERNGYNDSDFYAEVWDGEEGRVRTIEYATTRGWTYNNSATVDADEEAKARAANWDADRYRESLKSDWAADAARIVKGRTVRFTRTFTGRKQGRVDKGTEGSVVWVGLSAGGYTREERAGVQIDGREEPVWVNTWNTLEVVNPEPINEELIEREVVRLRNRMVETGRVRHFSPGLVNLTGMGSGAAGRGIIDYLTRSA